MWKKLFVATCVVLGVVIAWWWIAQAKTASLTVGWTSLGIPVIEATVDGKKSLLKLATGNKFFLSLNDEGLKFVADKTPRGTATWRDRIGTVHESPAYNVGNLSIGSLVFSNVFAQNKNENDEQNNMLWNTPSSHTNCFQKTVGEVGRPLLLKTNLLLDLGHDKIIMTNCENSLEKHGVFLNSMKKFSLEPEERGIVLKVDTDVGHLRLDINTGATISLFRSSLLASRPNYAAKMQKDSYKGLVYFTTDLVVGTTTLGRQEMYVTDLADEATWFDGCLGIDFLKKHIVYIDYRDKCVYIS